MVRNCGGVAVPSREMGIHEVQQLEDLGIECVAVPDRGQPWRWSLTPVDTSCHHEGSLARFLTTNLRRFFGTSGGRIWSLCTIGMVALSAGGSKSRSRVHPAHASSGCRRPGSDWKLPWKSRCTQVGARINQLSRDARSYPGFGGRRWSTAMELRVPGVYRRTVRFASSDVATLVHHRSR